MITDESDSALAVRDTARGSKHRTITGAINQLFRMAAKAFTVRSGEEPQPKARRRKSGEDTRDAFPATARAVVRRAATQPKSYAAASIFLSETLDWLHLWHNTPAANSDVVSASDAKQNSLSPHL